LYPSSERGTESDEIDMADSESDDNAGQVINDKEIKDDDE